MAYRLGMIWTDFRPDEGIMRAAGSGRSFFTSIVRGMGLVVEFGEGTSIQYYERRIPDTIADEVRTIHQLVSCSLATLCQTFRQANGIVQDW